MRHIITQTSPYAGLENGFSLERMPASQLTPQHSFTRIRKQNIARRDRVKTFSIITVFAVLLVFSLCFLCSIFYGLGLLTMQESRSIEMQSVDTNLPRDHVVDFQQHLMNQSIDRSENYLAYLPHSGFHNQRIAFENALVLARILNRTLIVPPMRLGKGIIRYFPFDRLYDLVSRSGKELMLHCNEPPRSWTSLPVDCLDHFDYTLIPWNWMMDLSPVEAEQNLVFRWDSSDEWLRETLGITLNDTFALKDTSPLQYRFVDSDPLDFPGTRYKEALAVTLLDQVPHRLLQLGTLFGSSRIRLRRRRNLELRGKVRSAMEFTNPHLLQIADNIKSKLGDVYIAAHLRLDDGHFATQSEATARLVWWRILHETLEIPEEVVMELEAKMTNATIRDPPQIPDVVIANRIPHLPFPPFAPSIDRKLSCHRSSPQTLSIPLLNAPLFISTDAVNPAAHPSLRIFLDTFPCVFFLSDFDSETSALDGLRSGYDGLSLKKFLIPFLDAIVASRAHEMIGTPGSTFSQFTEDILWRRYHGYEIQQRG